MSFMSTSQLSYLLYMQATTDMSDPKDDTLPDLDTVITLLRDHLLPKPILSHLPSALRLYGYLALISEKVKSEASRALTAHRELVARLRKELVWDGEDGGWSALLVQHGALLSEEVDFLKGMEKRDSRDEMFGLSLELRKYVSALHLRRDISQLIVSAAYRRPAFYPQTQSYQSRGVARHLFPFLFIFRYHPGQPPYLHQAHEHPPVRVIQGISRTSHGLV
jgi:hypothetical protein